MDSTPNEPPASKSRPIVTIVVLLFLGTCLGTALFRPFCQNHWVAAVPKCADLLDGDACEACCDEQGHDFAGIDSLATGEPQCMCAMNQPPANLQP